MSVYLIDYENVNFSGLEGVGSLLEGDEVVLFYSDTASTIPMNLHIDVQRSGAKVRYIRIEKTAKNYLDFQLAAISGYLVGTTEQTEFVVISRDTGFDSVLDLWNTQDFVGRELTFRRQDSIGGNIPIRRKKKAKPASQQKKGEGTSGRKKAENGGSRTSGVKKTEDAADRLLGPDKAKDEKAAKNAASKGNTGKKQEVQQAEGRKQTARKTSGGKKQQSQKKTGGEKQQSQKKTGGKMAGKAAEAGNSAAAEAAGGQNAAPVEVKKILPAEKAQIREAVKDFGLAPTDYTKIYRTFEKAVDKHTYDIGLIKNLKNQDLGNRIYKATLPVFTARQK